MSMQKRKRRLINPPPTSAATTKAMKGNRAKNTLPEIRLRKELWKSGLRGYRLHPSSVLGRPDICFIARKIAIFVNGCFWHRCARCSLPLPKGNRKFWREKFRRNRVRDRRKARCLRQNGWHVLTVWECQIRSDASKVAQSLTTVIRNSSTY
jgi:DNA mismatch endonuclease, patch repair protein